MQKYTFLKYKRKKNTLFLIFLSLTFKICKNCFKICKI